MPDKLSDNICKNIIRRVALKHKIEPKLIVTQLMDAKDKKDMRGGKISESVLDLHVQVWAEIGMPDFVSIS